MRAALLALLLLGCSMQLGVPLDRSHAEKEEDMPESINRIAADYWEATLRRNPFAATQLGDRRFDAMVPDLRPETLNAWKAELRGFLQRIEGVQAATISPDDAVTHQTLRIVLERELQVQQARRDYWHVNQLDGYQVALFETASMQRIDSVASGANYVQRLQRMGPLFEQHIANLERGLSQGISAPAIIVQRVRAQLPGIISAVDTAHPSSGLMLPLGSATGLKPAEQAALSDSVVRVSREVIAPALQRYRDFLRDVYLPRARRAVGISHLHPENPETTLYAAFIAQHGDTDEAPEVIHTKGEAELQRLRGAMLGIARAAGHASIEDYVAALDADPAQHLATPAALLQLNERAVARARAAMPRAFATLPQTPLEIRAVESYRESEAVAAFYYPAPLDGSRPAYFYVNTHSPETQPVYNMEATAYHEALPGHHLQISLAQDTDLPDFRRLGDFTAYVEGWALYSELLADELGLYTSPSARFGMLNMQAFRAARLVVDTGLHSMGWTREQAIDFMQANLAMSHEEIVNEVDRYIVWPGQALAYMLGRMHLQSLRAKQEAHLGPAFDLRQFHTQVLGHGPLPMDVLLEQIAKTMQNDGTVR